MAWAEQWSHKIDGTEVNDKVNYLCQVPQLETGSDDTVILVPVDGAPPSYIRNQPNEAIYTFLINVLNATNWATWATRRAALFALFTNGPHTYTVQARGMAAPASTTIIVRGKIVDAKQRLMTVTAVVPTPLF